MVGSFLLILFGGISIGGGILKMIKIRTSPGRIEKKKIGALCLFLFTHFLLGAAGFYTLFLPLSLWFISLINTGALLSRWLNGRVFFSKNHWPHYLFTGGLLAAASFLLNI